MDKVIEVSKIVYSNGSWNMFTCKEGTLHKGFVNNMTIKVGSIYKLSGEIEQYNDEEQFKFSICIESIPTDGLSLIKYVTKDIIGIGAVTVKKIHSIVGDSLSDNMHKLQTVLKEVQYNELVSAVSEIEANSDKISLIEYLMDSGFSDAMASNIYDAMYNDDDSAYDSTIPRSLEAIKKNPYSLCSIKNIGFVVVDSKRVKFNILDDSVFRVNACILYVLQEITATGDSYVNWTYVNNTVLSYLGIEYSNLVVSCFSNLHESLDIYAWTENGDICSKKVYISEERIYEYLKTVSKSVQA